MVNRQKSDARFRREKIYLDDFCGAFEFKPDASSISPRQQTSNTIDFGILPKDRERAPQTSLIHPIEEIICQVSLIDHRIELMEDFS